MGIFSRDKQKSQAPEALLQKFTSNPTVINFTDLNSSNYITCSTAEGQALAYTKCSALATVINRRVLALKNGKVTFEDSAGKEIASNSLLTKGLNNPNRFQTLLEFLASIEHYKSLHGKAYIIKTDLGALSEYYVVPNTLVNVVTSSAKSPFEKFAGVQYYNVWIGTSQKRVSKEDMFVISDIDCSNSNAFVGDSRLVSLSESINTFISSYEAATELMSNRGMLGIISLYDESIPSIASNAIPQSKQEKEDVQRELGKFGMLRKQFKYAVTNKRANFVQVSANMNDLGITEVQGQCKKDIAYAYGVPAILLDMAGGTFSNVNEAQKSFYSDTVIPSVNATAEEVSRMMGAKFRIKIYYDHLDCFQLAKQQQASGMASLVTALNNATASGLMTTEEARRQLDMYLIGN